MPTGRQPHDRANACRFDSANRMASAIKVERTVLKVDDDEVKSRVAHEFNHVNTAQAAEYADGRGRLRK